MKRNLPNFNYRALSGYMPVDRPIDDIVNEQIQTVIEQTQNQHMKQWYMSAHGRMYLYLKINGDNAQA